jgi:dTDP-3-amino-3,4,6-trideoxy-alpha-D-glucose transaminase
MIPLNDFRRQWEDAGEAALEAFAAVGASGWYILGDEVVAFESALANCWGMSHAIGVASGLDALEIALRIAGCGRRDRVLTTPLSAFATTLAIVKLGALPCFVDTDEHGSIDLEQCGEVLARRSDIRFLLPVHLYGHSVDAAALASLRDRFGCTIVEDCAQSVLASSGGRPAGSTGRLAATSFYPTKNLGAMGDGGAILTNNDVDAAAARALRDYGQTAKYRHEVIGYNSRLDELQAALLRRVYLPRLAGWTARRRQVAAAYLAGIDNPGVLPIAPPAWTESAWHLFPVRVDPARKKHFMSYLKQNEVASGEHYPTPIPDQIALRDAPFEQLGECATAKAIAASEVSLPIHPYLTDGEVSRVIEVCNGWRG